MTTAISVPAIAAATAVVAAASSIVSMVIDTAYAVWYEIVARLPNGVISRADGKAMAAQIKKVYRQGDFVGSLVIPTAADRARPTNWTDVSPAPDAIAWREFPGLVEHVTFGLRARAGIF